MSFYLSTALSVPFDQAISDVTTALAKRGFGILTDIDVRETLKKKLDADIPPYRILGACNPRMALAALQIENKIGTMLPCNVVVRETSEGGVEVAAVDPVASMKGIEAPGLAEVAEQVRELLRQVITELSATGSRQGGGTSDGLRAPEE